MGFDPEVGSGGPGDGTGRGLAISVEADRGDPSELSVGLELEDESIRGRSGPGGLAVELDGGPGRSEGEEGPAVGGGLEGSEGGSADRDAHRNIAVRLGESQLRGAPVAIVKPGSGRVVGGAGLRGALGRVGPQGGPVCIEGYEEAVVCSA